MNKNIDEARLFLENTLNRSNDLSNEIFLINKNIVKKVNMIESVSLKLTEFSKNNLAINEKMINEYRYLSEESVEIRNLSNDYSKKTKKNMELLKKSKLNFSKIKNFVNENRDISNFLENEIDKITYTVKLINDISEKISILSFNAAIESAKAGEKGRGFEVISNEVRLFANVTKDEIKKVYATISEFDKNVCNVIEKLDNMLGLIEKEIEFSDKIYSDTEKSNSFINEILLKNSKNIETVEASEKTVKMLNQKIKLLSKEIDDLKNQVKQIKEEILKNEKVSEDLKNILV